MALPGVPQIFAVEGARDLSDKLYEDICCYVAEPDQLRKMWKAFDCAVTAWHISDWLWRERKAAGLFTGNVQDFQNEMQVKHRALRLCKYIATASKHSGVDYSQDPTIKFIIQSKQRDEQEPSDENLLKSLAEIDRAKEWEILIEDALGFQDAAAVFYQAQSIWDQEILADERAADSKRFAPED